MAAAVCASSACCPFALERQVHLAEQELPAAGAFVDPAFFTFGLGVRRVAFWITYTQGAADGFPVFRVFFQNGVETSRILILDQGSLVVAQPEGNVDVVQETLNGPAPADGDPIDYLLSVVVPPGAIGVRLSAAELGDDANPGTLAIAVTGDGGW